MDSGLAAVIAIYALPVVFAITLHEAAHGYVARRFGDLTAYRKGRISLNPLRHIDPVGTVLVPLGFLLLGKLAGTGGVLFGWAKPVPVNFGNLRRPKQDMLWVAAAGPAANFAMASFWALVLKTLAYIPGVQLAPFLGEMAQVGIEINVWLMVLNLLPVPPLDGGRIAVSLLPSGMAERYARIERFGLLILLALLFSRMLDAILWPFFQITVKLLAFIFGLGLT